MIPKRFKFGKPDLTQESALHPVNAIQCGRRSVVESGRGTLDERKNLCLIQVNDFLGREESARTQKRLKPPPSFGRHVPCCGMHLQLCVEHAAEHLEIFSELQRAVENVEGFFGGVECDLVRAPPHMQFMLHTTQISKDTSMARERTVHSLWTRWYAKRFPAV